MDMLNFDFSSLFTLTNILIILLGTMVGLFIGSLPGLGASVSIVLLLPLTFNLPPLAAILLLVSAYQAAEYGGSISSIILGVPGTPAAAATILDGNALSKKGSPGKALIYSLTASSIGGLFGGAVLLFFAEPIARFALQMSAPEFFLIGVLGLVAVASISSSDPMKSLISVLLGLMLGTVGIDMFAAVSRFTLGRPELMDGISIVALLVGMYAISEIFTMISKDLNGGYTPDTKGLKTRLTFNEFKKIIKPTAIGSTIGSIIGVFPGMGAGSSSWFAYIAAKKASKNPESFGTGNPEGIVAPESANNATVGGALVPLLSLGIPGSPATAIIMGAFIVHGIRPGPNIFSSNTNLVYGIFFGFILATFAMYFLGRLITPLFSRILTVPIRILIPAVFILSIIGVYASDKMFFYLWFAIIIGIISFFLKGLNYSIPALFLAFVLSPIIEENLRRSLIISQGSYSVFFTRLYSIILLLIIISIIVIPFLQRMKSKIRKKRIDKNF